MLGAIVEASQLEGAWYSCCAAVGPYSFDMPWLVAVRPTYSLDASVD